MQEEQRLQEYSQNRDNVKQLSNKKLINTPATNKSQQHSPQQPVIQQVLTQHIAIQEYNNQLIAHLNILLVDKKEKFFQFIRSFEKVKLEKQVQGPKNGLINYLTKMYNSQASFKQQFLAKVVEPALDELTIIAKKIIKTVLQKLTIEQRQKYRRIENFSLKFLSMNEKIFDQEKEKIIDEEDKNKQIADNQNKLLTIDDLVRLDILLLFLLKNNYYLQMFDIEHLIAPEIIRNIFLIKNYKYLRLKERFLETVSILEPAHFEPSCQQVLQEFMNLLCVVYLRQRIYLNHRRRKTETHKERRIFNKLLSRSTKKYQPFGTKIKFQFCEVALLNKCTKHAKSKIKTKQDAIVKLMLNVIKQTDANLNEQLIVIKEETTTSLESLVQLYNYILLKEFEKVNSYDVEYEKQKQIEACQWIYLSHVVARKNKSVDTYFYRQGKPITKFDKTFNIILKKALQRYQLFAGASLTLLNILHQFPQPPMVYICRFEYSYNHIKGISYPLKKQKSTEKTEEDLKCTQIIGVCQGKILFSALRNSNITDQQFKQFLTLYFGKFHQDKKYNIALQEFEHNRRNNWDVLGTIIFDLKSKFGFNVFVLNYPPAFLQHLSINACLRYLLKDNSDQIARGNFYSKVHTFQRDVIKTFRSAEARQILLKFLPFTDLTRKT